MKVTLEVIVDDAEYIDVLIDGRYVDFGEYGSARDLKEEIKKELTTRSGRAKWAKFIKNYDADIDTALPR